MQNTFDCVPFQLRLPAPFLVTLSTICNPVEESAIHYQQYLRIKRDEITTISCNGILVSNGLFAVSIFWP